MNTLQSIIEQLRRGPRSTAELAAVLGLNPSSITRAIAGEPLIIQMGRARAARYGLLEGLPIITEQKISLSWWVNASVILGGLSTFGIFLFTALMYLKPVTSSG